MENERVIVDGKEEEVVRVVCDKVESNELGFYVTYRSYMKEGEKEFGVEEVKAPTPVDPATMLKADLAAELDAAKVTYASNANKDELVALVVELRAKK